MAIQRSAAPWSIYKKVGQSSLFGTKYRAVAATATGEIQGHPVCQTAQQPEFEKADQAAETAHDPTDLLFDGGLDPAKGDDAAFRPQAVGKKTGAHTICEENAVARKKVFTGEAGGNGRFELRRQCQNVDQIPLGDDIGRANVATAQPLAPVHARLQKGGRLFAQGLLGVPDVLADLQQPGPFIGIQPVDLLFCGPEAVVDSHSVKPPFPADAQSNS